MINATDFAFASEQRVVEMCHNATAVPSVIIIALSIILFLTIVGLASVRTKESRKKILGIIFLTLLFSTIVVLFVVFSPNGVQAFSNFFIDIFGS